MRSRRVSRADYGDRWPLTVDEGELRSDGMQVTFVHDGTEYGVNGMATGRGFPDIAPLWADNPTGRTPKIDIGPLIDDGLALVSRSS